MAIYLDSNVFIFAAIAEDKRAKKAQSILKEVLSGSVNAVTSALTMDEVLWVLWKETKNRDFAIEQCQRILEFDNLELIDVNKNIIQDSMHLMRENPFLKPRDSIHLASAFNNNITQIVSDDADFDNVKEIERIELE